MVVNFVPLSGLLNQSHYIPLSFLPLEIELELATDATANIIHIKSAKGRTGETYADDNGVSEKLQLNEFKLL